MKNLLLHLIAALSLSLMLINTLFWCAQLFVVALLKFILPIETWRKGCNYILILIAESFIDVNSWILTKISGVSVTVNQTGKFEAQDSYLVISNHQSYADIILLQKTLNHQIPFLKFFLKQQLIWIPVFGLAWWALDFPFMKRYSKEYIKKHPEKAGEDFEATRKACEKFKHIPVSIMNFAEGTRFTQEKNSKQDSPFQNLLKPKAGGIGYVLSLMGDQINHLVDITIDYNCRDLSLWSMLSGKLDSIEITIEIIPLPEEIKGDYINNSASRVNLQRWMNELWKKKDAKLSS